MEPVRGNLALKDGLINLTAYVAGMLAIGAGVAFAVSVAWSSVVLGVIVLATVLIARIGSRKE